MRTNSTTRRLHREAIELQDLRQFSVVAEHLNFGRAADQIGIKQPPLSRAIKQLESRLGHTLFDRTGRRTTLTKAGQALLDEVGPIIAAVDKLVPSINRSMDAGRLLIGMSPSARAPEMARLLAEVRAHDSGLAIEVRECSKPATAAVADYDILLSPDATLGPQVSGTPLWRAPLWLVVPERHALSAREGLLLADIPADDTIHLNRDLTSITRRLARQRLHISPVEHLDVELARSIVACRSGLPIVTTPIARSLVDSGTRVLRLLDDDAVLQVHAYALKANNAPWSSRFLSLAGRLFAHQSIHGHEHGPATTRLNPGSATHAPHAPSHV